MEHWFQSIFLTTKRCLLILFCGTISIAHADDSPNIDTEYFDIGAFVGLINIQDFNSEIILGTSATFNANEDYFLQFNYLQADTSRSSFEQSQGALLAGNDRQFRHYDFLVGYNLFQGEHFFSSTKAKLTSFYLVGGVGDTEFGAEGSFTYTLGAGYQIALLRNVILKIDYRDYMYKTNLIGENKTTHNTQLSAGLSYSF
jgi:outer membrane beta-barrel protein